MARYIDATQLQAKILDASIKNKLSESREVLKIFDKMVQYMPTADVVPRSEVEHILSDLKKQIHDRAVYPHNAGISPYVSLKVVDALINNLMSR